MSNKKYITDKQRKNAINISIGVIILLILDVITTLYLLSVGSSEANPILLFFTKWFSITDIVIYSHIGAIVLTILSIYYIKHKKDIETPIYWGVIATFIVYMLVIFNNCIGVGVLL